MAYQLGDFKFKYKKEAKAYIRSVREKYEYGNIINAQDSNVIKDAIATMKEDKRPKIEDIDFIKVEKIVTGRGRPHKNFIIYLRNGKDASFKIGNCFPSKNSKVDINRTKFNEAARKAIQDQTSTFKKEQKRDNGKYWCILGNREIPSKEVHVDHDNPSFKELISNFIKVENIQLDEIKYVKEMNKPNRFKDKKLERKWQIHHEHEAKLQILCAQCNLRKKKK